MTAVVMASMGSAATTAARLDTTITVAGEDWFDDGTEDTYFAYGFSVATPDPLGLGAFGSISDDTFLDGNSVSRTVVFLYWSEPTGGLSPSFDDNLYFGLSGVGVPDADTTFKEIEYNGVTYTRSAADGYTSSVGATNTYWQWNDVSPNPPTTGVRDFKVIL